MTIQFRVSLTSLLLTLLFSFSVAQPSAAPPLPADIPPTAERYSFLMMGNLAGHQAVWTASDGLHIFFQFNDRGRGPKTTTILKLGPDGIPVSEAIIGNDYMKAAVTENYSLDNGTARWKNDDEQGEKKISSPAFYSSLNGGPSEIALLAHAALANGGKIALLPEGEAHVKRISDLDPRMPRAGRKTSLSTLSPDSISPPSMCGSTAKDFFATVDTGATVCPRRLGIHRSRPARRAR